MNPGPIARRGGWVALLIGAVALVGCGAAGPPVASPAAPQGSVSAVAPPAATPTAPPVRTQAEVVASKPAPVSTPCDTNTRARYVYVSLRRQHMWLCAKHRVALATAITSGMVGQYTETPTGRYTIQGRNRNTVLTLNTGAAYDVKYWIPFDGPLFGFHDSSWQDFPYGSDRYRTAGSHGCVHMPLAAIRYLYNWADIGTPVRIAA
ncbi:MAG: hypothetical protein QOC66_800 [Pseudonocardiales bacterium]|jgi:lipoprotein-anchoring transpeptidase ErfK/SrfK|nr:hypothetical protein [Pseudonocardiales bacterium]